MAKLEPSVEANENMKAEEETPCVPPIAAIDGVRVPRQRRRKRIDLKSDFKPCDCEMCPIDDEGDEAEEEADPPRAVRDPGQPTQAMIDEHNLSHIPFRPWCAACVRGKAKNKPSLTVKGDFAESVLPRVRLDYGLLTERDGEDDNVEGQEEKKASEDPDTVFEDPETVADNAEDGDDTRMTILVMQESLCRSVWPYAVTQKGAADEWAVHQLCYDLELSLIHI